MSIPWASTSTDFDMTWYHTANEVPDILETMFAQQRLHMEEYAKINPTALLDPELHGALDDPATQATIRETAGYVMEELMEAVSGHLKNKPWKQTLVPVSERAFREELADAWHFLIQLHIVAGMTPHDVFDAYFKKAQINTERQRDGY